MNDRTKMSGWVVAEVIGPDGSLRSRHVAKNLITQVGDRVYGERGGGVTGAPNAPTGMKLGTGSTAAAKTGSGAALASYLSGSNASFEAGYPSSALESGARRISYRCIWPAGTATSSSIREVVLVNESPLANQTSDASETISRVVFGADIDKGASDQLQITWSHDLEGT